jgi:D-3-phosphoglycerate dehydrogenase / 2-oxoglutarate reductase
VGRGLKVLIADPLDPAALAALRARGLEPVERGGLAGDALVAALDGVDGVIVRGATKLTADVLARARTLRAIVRAGTGLDNVDLATAKARGMFVSNTPAANAVSVAELVFGLLLALERHLVPAASDLARGRWEKTKYAGRELAGRTLGVVGFGRIGREVATRARAFAMAVVAHDPLLPEWPAEFAWAPRRGLEPLLAESDVVTLHLPLAPDTRGLIDAARIARMKPGAVLVNAARGGIVDEAALAVALREGRLSGAALDVFEREPAPADHPLLALPNVIATPHLGASTAEAQQRAGAEAAAIMARALLGEG